MCSPIRLFLSSSNFVSKPLIIHHKKHSILKGISFTLFRIKISNSALYSLNKLYHKEQYFYYEQIAISLSSFLNIHFPIKSIENSKQFYLFLLKLIIIAYLISK